VMVATAMRAMGAIAIVSATFACSGGVEAEAGLAARDASPAEGASDHDADGTADADAAIGCGPLNVMVRIEGTVLVWRDAARGLRDAAASLEAQGASLCQHIATELKLDASKPDVAGACSPVNERVASAVAKGVTVSVVPVFGFDFDPEVVGKYQTFCAASAGCDLQAACAPDQWLSRCSGTCDGTCEASLVHCAGQCTGICSINSHYGTCAGWCAGSCDDAPWTGNCAKGCSASFSGTCNAFCEGTCDGAPSTSHCPGWCEGTCNFDASGTCGAKCTGTFEGNCVGLCFGTCEAPAGDCDGYCMGTCLSPDDDCYGVCHGTCPSAPFQACGGTLSCPVDPNCLASCEGFKTPWSSTGDAHVFVAGDEGLYQALLLYRADLAFLAGAAEVADRLVQGLDGELVAGIAADPAMTPPVAACLDAARQDLEQAKASVARALSASASLQGNATW
jgi:hypothetical protein